MRRRVFIAVLTAALFGRAASAQVFNLFPLRSTEYLERRFAGSFAIATGTYATAAIQVGLAPGSNSIRSSTATAPTMIGMPGSLASIGESPRELVVGAIGTSRVVVWLEGRREEPAIQLSVDLRSPVQWTAGPVSAPAIDCDPSLCVVAVQGPSGRVHLGALVSSMSPQVVPNLIAPDPNLNASAPLLAPAVVIVPGSPRTVIVAVNVAEAGVRSVKLHRIALGTNMPFLPPPGALTRPIVLPSRNVAPEPPTLTRVSMGYAVAVRVGSGAHVYRGSVSGSLSVPVEIGASPGGTMSDVQLANNGTTLLLGYLEQTTAVSRPAMLREVDVGGVRGWSAVRRVALQDATADRVRFASGSPPLLTFDGPAVRGMAVEGRGIFADDRCDNDDDCVVVDDARRCARSCRSGVCATILGMCVRIFSDAGVSDGGALDAGVGPDASEDVLDASADQGSSDSARDGGVDNNNNNDVGPNATPITVRFNGGACSCSVVASPSTDTRSLAGGVVCAALALARRVRRRRRG
jgi:hypothetical protein